MAAQPQAPVAAPAAAPAAARREAADLAAQLPPLMEEAERLAASLMAGAHGRRRAGPGGEFWQYRAYGAGDAARRIDWRRSARGPDLYVRDQEWDAAQTVWLWRPAGAGVDFRSNDRVPTKSRRMTVLLLALAMLLIRGGERVGFLGDGDSPTRTRAGLDRLARAALAGGATTGLDRHRPGGAAVLFSDWYAPVAESTALIEGLAGRELRCVLVQVFDPAEALLPYDGRVRFLDPDGAPPLLVPSVSDIRVAYRRRFEAQATAVGALAGHHGWPWLRHRTDRGAATALAALIQAVQGAPGGAGTRPGSRR